LFTVDDRPVTNSKPEQRRVKTFELFYIA